MHKVVALHPPAAGDLAARLEVHDRADRLTCTTVGASVDPPGTWLMESSRRFCLVLAQWRASGLWVIGLFVGIDLIFYGGA